jgi:hypothetical protein
MVVKSGKYFFISLGFHQMDAIADIGGGMFKEAFVAMWHRQLHSNFFEKFSMGKWL